MKAKLRRSEVGQIVQLHLCPETELEADVLGDVAIFRFEDAGYSNGAEEWIVFEEAGHE